MFYILFLGNGQYNMKCFGLPPFKISRAHSGLWCLYRLGNDATEEGVVFLQFVIWLGTRNYITKAKSLIHVLQPMVHHDLDVCPSLHLSILLFSLSQESHHYSLLCLS